jgi:hypothetical protein
MGDRIDDESGDVMALLRMVEGEAAEQNDSISDKVTDRDPVLATAVAYAWACTCLKYVNAVFAGSRSGSG